VADGDVPGDGAGGNAAGDGAGGNAAGGDGEEAAWLDLIARFGAPAPGDGDAPWPEREDLAGPVHVTPAPPAALPPTVPPVVPEALPREPPTNPSGLPPMTGQPWPRLGSGYGPGPRDARAPVDPAEDHFVPPTPPPLPKLDPITKGAWLALFGGPVYLLIATAVGWEVSGLAAFLAVAAFVGGFVVLVLRMDNGGPRDSGPDDGAIV
jgi:hypothetical protein